MKPASSHQDRPAPLPLTPTESRPPGNQARRTSSSSSGASSTTSNQTTLNVSKRSLYGLNHQQQQQQPQSPTSGQPSRPPSMGAGSVNGSTTSLSGALRPQNEPVQRRASPLAPSSSSDTRGFRSRHHSQGFFEPSLPTASQSSAAVSASRIAAQAAMQHQTEQQHQQQQHIRNRSQTIPPQQESGIAARRGVRDSPPPIQTNVLKPQMSLPGQLNYQNGSVGGRAAAATTAANVAFPRTPTPQSAVTTTTTITGGVAEPAQKQKSEKSKMKLFSKPKHIGMSRDKEDKKDKTMPSPSKLASRIVNASTASVNDTSSSSNNNNNNNNNNLSTNNSSLYSLANSSATTVVPIERHSLDEDRGKEKEKHRHHFLSRQKLKLKDKDDHFHLPLSCASSNSRPLDPSAPQSLYSFAPSSPAVSTFGKSMSGLDLRHGGRALREKKKEEKASAAAAAAAAAAQQDAMMRDGEHQADWSGAASVTGSTVNFGGPSSSLGSAQGGILPGNNAAIQEVLQGFGLQNMTPDDAWDFLKAKLLVLFEGEDVRIALEDLNKLVRVHIQCCVQKHMPHEVVEDLRDLLQTGFASLNYSIFKVPEENIIPHLVNVWVFAFGTILPFIQATFLPLDLEFKGHGSIMNAREAKEFWGAKPGSGDTSASVGDDLDVRKIVLTSFRDNVILTRYEVLKAAFSRLSLEKMNANINGPPTATLHSTAPSASRPSTSAGYETGGGSYNSQPTSSHLNAGSFSSESAIASLSRARAISNTSSNPEHTYPSSYSSYSPSQPSILSQVHTTNHPAPPQPPPLDPSHITETAGRMLQCICVLASVQSDDDAQQKIEELSKALKHNWLGRGRTGRNRRGFVGTKIRPPPPPRKESGEQAERQPTDET